MNNDFCAQYDIFVWYGGKINRQLTRANLKTSTVAFGSKLESFTFVKVQSMMLSKCKISK